MPRITDETISVWLSHNTERDAINTTIAIAQVNTLCDLVDAVKELTEAVKNDKRVYNCDVHLTRQD